MNITGHITALEFRTCMRLLGTVTEDEFRLAGCFRTPRTNLASEEARRREFHAFRSNPHLWVRDASPEEADRLWTIISAKLEANYG